MKVLLLNWRDIRSPRAGGAERVTYEVARGLVARGHEVTWLASRPQGITEDETIDGVRIVRRGGELTTRAYAPAIARNVRPDVILEEINTLPYLAPVWSKVPVLLYMNQLARDVWWYEAPRAVAAVGFAAEPLYLKAYRACDAVTISLSSRDDLRQVGIRGTISVAPMVADIARVDTLGAKSRTGALVAVGRLTPSKRYEDAIRALAEIHRAYPTATLTLVGDGRCADELEREARLAGVASAVVFAGRVDEQRKTEILTAADILIGTSVREGWGLTVTEAAARGTPAVVYDIPGFRDSVVDGRTGFLVPPSPSALVGGVQRLLADPALYDRLRVAAWQTTTLRSWEAAISAFEIALTRALTRRRAGSA